MTLIGHLRLFVDLFVMIISLSLLYPIAKSVKKHFLYKKYQKDVYEGGMA
jgi:hypothetical protein